MGKENLLTLELTMSTEHHTQHLAGSHKEARERHHGQQAQHRDDSSIATSVGRAIGTLIENTPNKHLQRAELDGAKVAFKVGDAGFKGVDAAFDGTSVMLGAESATLAYSIFDEKGLNKASHDVDKHAGMMNKELNDQKKDIRVINSTGKDAKQQVNAAVDDAKQAGAKVGVDPTTLIAAEKVVGSFLSNPPKFKIPTP